MNTKTLEQAIAAVLKNELRLVSGPIAEDCPCNGECDCDRTWRVKPGNIEHCAHEIMLVFVAAEAMT